MAKSRLPDAGYLRNLLKCDPETGELFWLPRPADKFPNERRCKRWNTMYAGAPAFYSINKAGYRYGSIDGRTYYAHRLIWKIVTGKDPLLIDHINGNRSDNRLTNLREVNHRDNCRNSAFHKDGTSGAIGVSYYRNRWVATIWDGANNVYLGRYKLKDDAIVARKKAENKYGFHPNHGRTPL